MIIYLLLILSSLLTGCGRNPVTGKSEIQLITESQEIQIGEENFRYLQQIEGGDYVTDPKLQSYVSHIGMSLARLSDRPQLPYQFVIIDNPIPNAWSLPGGKIGINRGLLVLLDNEAELAAVLAHEIVHSAARHSAKGIERSLLIGAGLAGAKIALKNNKYEDVIICGAQAGAGLLVLHYSRDAEYEADRYGIEYIVRAGYEPYAAVTLQEKFLKLSKQEKSRPPTIFSSHPPSEDRIRENIQIASHYHVKGKLGAQEYQTMISPLKDQAPAYEKLQEGYEAFVLKQYHKALKLADEGIALSPRIPHLWGLKGKSELKLDDLINARNSLNRAIEINDHYFEFYYLRGIIEHREGNYKAARRDFQKSYDLLPTEEAAAGLNSTKMYP